jgi:hypothetical protein
MCITANAFLFGTFGIFVSRLLAEIGGRERDNFCLWIGQKDCEGLQC